MGPLTFASPTQTWSRTLPAPPGDALDVIRDQCSYRLDRPVPRVRRLQRDAEHHDQRTDHDLADGL
jgi:hypothetical protein